MWYRRLPRLCALLYPLTTALRSAGSFSSLACPLRVYALDNRDDTNMPMKPLTQTQKIEAHLMRGEPLTPIKAIGLYSCTRLAAVVHRLNKQYDRKSAPRFITSEQCKTADGRPYAKYTMVKGFPALVLQVRRFHAAA